VKALLPLPEDLVGIGQLELGQDHKDWRAAELRWMVPLNGRVALIFRLPRGFPAVHM
jgi:hypothetical protein